MKTLIAITLLSVTGTIYSQTSLKEGPIINNLALGATRQEVIKKFGEPDSESRRKADECVGGTELTIRYPGLILWLWDDPEDPKNFTVGMFEVTSAKWNVSGVRVGQTSSFIKGQFGIRDFEDNEEKNQTSWSYGMDEEKSPGTTTFFFRNGKVTKISAAWLMC